MKIEELIPNTKLYEALQTGEAKYDQLFETIDDRKVLYNCLPIKNEYGEILGVATASSLNTALQIENLQERIERLEESNILLNRQLHGFNQAPEIFESIIGISDKIIELKKILSRICNTQEKRTLYQDQLCRNSKYTCRIRIIRLRNRYFFRCNKRRKSRKI